MHYFSLKTILTLAIMAAVCFTAQSVSAAYEREPQKPAIVIAAFGTTDVEALASILNVENKIEKAFPSYDVHLAFTSNIIRDVWHKRAGDKAFRKNNPQIPEKIYNITNPMTVLANIQEEGSRLVLVQSLHITSGEEFGDLKSIINQLAGIKTLKRSLHPFPWIGLGEPALGSGKSAELDRAAKALKPLVDQAKKENSALVLLGHGNEHKEMDVYGKFEKTLQKMYDHKIFIGLVEGNPGLEDVLKELEKAKPASILLAPLMVVAGDHAKNDMAGDEGDSWSSTLTANGFKVSNHLQGLGSDDSWADIYVEHLKALEAEIVKQKNSEEAKAAK